MRVHRVVVLNKVASVEAGPHGPRRDKGRISLLTTENVTRF